jgi:hypothetical protein
MRLSAAFFHEHVAPLADSRIGRDNYAAALLGGGSEVLGLDTEMSQDHDWGPRLTLFVSPEAEAEATSIAADLPNEFQGVSREFGSKVGGAPWVHPFEVTSVAVYFDGWIGFHQRDQATLLDWLATPAMSFLAVTAGTVFHDGPGHLRPARQVANWYPDDVWRWLAACQWRRISEEQSFIERAASAGDTLGASVIASRVVRDAMRLAFLLESRYAPYSKWLGSAITTLPIGRELAPSLTTAMSSPTDDGPAALGDALERLGALTNERFGVTVDPSRRQFFNRPMLVAPAGEFSAALLATVNDPRLQTLSTNVGNVDMLYGTNNGSYPGARAAYRELLTAEGSPTD